jgi:enamine deaminase RidA (YjgF/YER057c/UK114 family)
MALANSRQHPSARSIELAQGVEARLADLGLTLPPPWTPRGAFLPWRREGNLLFLSGQICEREGSVVVEGPVGAACSVEQAKAAAQICALNLLFHIKAACGGDLDAIAEIVRLGGFVNCVPGFPDAPAVINGASEIFISLYGEAGRHARTAIGVAGLPGNAAVEVDAIVRLA